MRHGSYRMDVINMEFKIVPNEVRIETRMDQSFKKIKGSDDYESFEEPTDYLVAPCGYSERTTYTKTEEFMKRHVKECAMCKVVTGKSKATVFKQDEVVQLFAMGYTLGGIEIRTPESNSRGWKQGGNTEADNHAVRHYGVLNMIRTESDRLIVSTQDWAAGWASVPGFPRNTRDSFKIDAHLPLTTLSNIGDVWSIEVMQTDHPSVLFTMKTFRGGETKQYLYGRDEQNFIVELPIRVTNVADAFESLKPSRVKKWEIENNASALRQGDYFFIPSKLPVPKNIKTVVDPFLEREKMVERSMGYDNSHIVKQLVRPQIREESDNSRHTAKLIYTLGDGNQLVMGPIRHPEHRQLVLDKNTLYYALKNVAVRSYNADVTSGRGLD